MVAHSSILAWEDSRDRGDWRTIVHAVTKESHTTEQLSKNCKYTEIISILKSFSFLLKEKYSLP